MSIYYVSARKSNFKTVDVRLSLDLFTFTCMILIDCIIVLSRVIKRDISLTRTNILANKQMIAAEEEMVNNLHLRMEQAAHMNNVPAHHQGGPLPQSNSPNNTMTIPRPNVSIYNKNGWHESYADRSFYDNNTDIYPESNTTTRSTGPFIVDSPKHARVPSNGGQSAFNHSTHNGGIGIVAPYTVNTINRNGPFVIDGQAQDGFTGRGVVEQQRVGGHYANDIHEWHPECLSDNEPDLVMF